MFSLIKLLYLYNNYNTHNLEYIFPGTGDPNVQPVVNKVHTPIVSTSSVPEVGMFFSTKCCYILLRNMYYYLNKDRAIYDKSVKQC